MRGTLDFQWRFAAALSGILALCATAALADAGDGRYHDHHGMMGWGGWFYGPFMMLLFFGLLVGAVILVARLLGNGTSRDEGRTEDRSLAILRERLASGDITREEFEETKRVIQGGTT